MGTPNSVVELFDLQHKNKKGEKKMVKRILCVCALILALVCILTSCGGEVAHVHSYGEWETAKDVTLTEDGVKERNCVCGKKETEYISFKPYAYETALALIEDGNFEDSFEIFKNLGDYEDAKEQLSHFKYIPTKISEDDGDTVDIFLSPKFYSAQFIQTDDYDRFIYDYTFDANGNLIKKVATYPSGNKDTTDYTYDLNGNLIKEVETTYLRNKNTTDYTYDLNGNLIKEVYTYSNGNKNTYDYTYNLNGKLIKMVSTNYHGYKSTTNYTYDLNGNLIKQVITDNIAPYTIDYTYDLNGNLIKQVETLPDGSKGTTNYTYDLNGNLIKQVYTNYSYGYNYTYDFKYKLIYSTCDKYLEAIMDLVWERNY